MLFKNCLDLILYLLIKLVVGNMLLLDLVVFVQYLMWFVKEFGLIFWLDMMGLLIVVVFGYDFVDELFDEKCFDKMVCGVLWWVCVVGGDGLFMLDMCELNWSKVYNILFQFFGNCVMQFYYLSMVDIVEQFVQKWDWFNVDDEIDVVYDMIVLMLDMIGLCGFDYCFNLFYCSDYYFYVEFLVCLFEIIMMMCGLLFEQFWMQKCCKMFVDDVVFMNKMVDEIIVECCKSFEGIDDKKDMFVVMMIGVDCVIGE